jgi:hypothetical protein
VLVHAKTAANEGDRRFNLVLNTTPIVERVLEITGVLDTLNRVHTLEEALAADSDGTKGHLRRCRVNRG